MQRRWLRVLFVLAVMILVGAGVRALAAITTYTDRNAWLRAAGGAPDAVVNFHEFERSVSFAADPITFNAHNFGVVSPVFTASVIGGPTPVGENIVAVPSSITTSATRLPFDTPHLRVYGDDTTHPLFQFASSLTAVGMQVQVGEGQSRFFFTPTAGGPPMAVAGPVSDGFFGVISTTPFNAMNFGVRSIEIGGGAGPAATNVYRLAIDDVETVAAPEPMTLTLGLYGALMLAAYADWRFRVRK